MTTSIELLAQQIEALRVRQDRMARTPQLTRSAIDAGVVVITDGLGQQTGYVGQQFDGAYGVSVVAGPLPPIPSAPTATTVVGGIRVAWDGTFQTPQPGFTAPIVASTDMTRVDVEVSDSPSFPEHAAANAPSDGSIVSLQGGSVKVAWPGSNVPLYVRLRSRTTAGKRSDPGLTFGPINSGLIGLGDIGFNLADYAASNTIIFTTGATPSNPSRIGTIWLKQTAAGPPPRYDSYRWDGVTWILLQDQGVANAVASAVAAQIAADTKAKVFVVPTMPSWTGVDGSAIWFDSDDGNRPYRFNGTTFISMQLGNGAIAPNSLIASSVVVTGSVNAALLETILVLATSVVAGDANGGHARMTPTGFRVYRSTTEGTAAEVIRMGTDTSDYFAVVDQNGDFVATIDDTGNIAAGVVSADAVLLNGVDLSFSMTQFPLGEVARFLTTPGADIGPIYNRYGICEVGAPLTKGRAYRIDWNLTWKNNFDGDEARWNLIERHGTDGNVLTQPSAPVVTDTQFATFFATGGINGRWYSMVGTTQFYPTATTRYRFLLTQERGAGSALGTTYVVSSGNAIQLMVTDLGPAGATAGQLTAGGGTYSGGGGGSSPASTSQQYYVDLAPSGWASYRGNGTLRTDTTDVVQGWDPSGFNGDGGGYWTFSLPSITGTVDRMDFYVYSNHWYYNSGGTAILNMISGTGSGFESTKLTGNFFVGGYPKPGGYSVQLPSGWYPQFKNTPPSGARAVGISVGRSGGTNLTYYGRFTGDSARLRIYFTQ